MKDDSSHPLVDAFNHIYRDWIESKEKINWNINVSKNVFGEGNLGVEYYKLVEEFWEKTRLWSSFKQDVFLSVYEKGLKTEIKTDKGKIVVCLRDDYTENDKVMIIRYEGENLDGLKKI